MVCYAWAMVCDQAYAVCYGLLCIGDGLRPGVCSSYGLLCIGYGLLVRAAPGEQRARRRRLSTCASITDHSYCILLVADHSYCIRLVADHSRLCIGEQRARRRRLSSRRAESKAQAPVELREHNRP
jgi:hypothetical protein